MKFNHLLIAASCVAISGCNSINGTLTITGANFQLKDKKGQLVSLNQGNASVTMKSGKLLIKDSTINGKNDTIELLDPTKNLPSFQSDGEHMFLASQTGQPVNIKELTTNSVSASEEHEGWDNCSVIVSVEVPCPKVVPKEEPKPEAKDDSKDHPKDGAKDGSRDGGKDGPGKGGDGGGRPPRQASVATFAPTRSPAGTSCRADRVVSGHQAVQFHFTGDAFQIQLIMTDPKTDAQVATFQGYSYASNKVVDRYLSDCIPPGAQWGHDQDRNRDGRDHGHH